MAFDIERKRTLDLLAETGVDPQSFQSYLEKRSVNTYLNGIRESGARASRIVSDLLAFSRRSMSKFAPRNINSLVQQILALAETDYSLREKYDFRDVQVELDLHSGDLTVICDGQQIQQVMLNLLRNAVQAMNELALKQPDYVPQLRISTQDAGESVRLVIADNGPGVPEDVRERLFEPFMTTKEVGQGTGLGLWMSWSIINERHQGRIWLEEASENGSVFVIELPKNGPEDEF